MKYTVMIRSRVPTGSATKPYRTEWSHSVEAHSQAAARTKARRWMRDAISSSDMEGTTVSFYPVTETFAYLDLESKPLKTGKSFFS